MSGRTGCLLGIAGLVVTCAATSHAQIIQEQQQQQQQPQQQQQQPQPYYAPPPPRPAYDGPAEEPTINATPGVNPGAPTAS